MKNCLLIAASALALGACTDEAQEPVQAEGPAQLAPGLYEASWTVDSIRATEGSDPANGLEAGSTGSVRACVAEGPRIDPALFAEDGDECTAASSYVRGGRINMQLECNRPGKGRVMQTINGKSTADGFEADVSTSTYLSGPGDYSMARTFTARRAGECPADGAAEDQPS